MNAPTSASAPILIGSAVAIMNMTASKTIPAICVAIIGVVPARIALEIDERLTCLIPLTSNLQGREIDIVDDRRSNADH